MTLENSYKPECNINQGKKINKRTNTRSQKIGANGKW